jgi:putative thioredoxin
MDSTLATFEHDVIETSKQVPVLVDFWAPWSGPCHLLRPMLKELEAEYGGRWRLVKINVDENPELATRFQAHTIPFVLAFIDGRQVGQFQGILPEHSVRGFLNQFLPDPADVERRAARNALRAGHRTQARDHLQAALALDPGYDISRLDLIELLLGDTQIEAARVEMSLLSPRILESQDPRYIGFKTRVDAIDAAAALPSAASLNARLAANPADLDARFDLASRLIAEHALDI